MTSDSERRRRTAGREAAEWYVEIDANQHSREREAGLGEWLERAPEHEAAFERCEAAVMFARELAARGGLDEALRTEHPEPRRRAGGRARRAAGSMAAPLLELLRRPAVAWSVAAAATIWAVAASVQRDPLFRPDADASAVEAGTRGSPVERTAAPGARPVRAGGAAQLAGDRADDEARIDESAIGASMSVAGLPAAGTPPASIASVADAVLPASSFVNPVALLPDQIVVDVHSVAVLPFDGVLDGPDPEVPGSEAAAAAERIAMQLHEEVVRQLARIPGVYVVDGRSSTVYASGELGPAEIAAFLSVRGVVAADVEVDGDTVRVSLRMTDAVNDGRRIETIVERPLEELPAVRTAIVSNITDALDSTAF